MKGVIYKYTFPNGKVYIGQTRRNPDLRHKEHLDPVTGPCNSGFWKEYQKFLEYKYEIIEAIEEPNEDILVEKLNQLETFHIIKCKAFDPRFGCNSRYRGTESTGADRILQEQTDVLLTRLRPLKFATYDSISNKIWHTKEPLTDGEKEYMNEYFSRGEHMWTLPKSFDLDNIGEFDIEDYNNGNAFRLQEAFDEWYYDLNIRLQYEISSFVRENAADILASVRDRDTICALDSDGNVALTFYSFNEIAQYFGVARPDNVRNVLKGKQKSAYGFFWKYKRDL